MPKHFHYNPSDFEQLILSGILIEIFGNDLELHSHPEHRHSLKFIQGQNVVEADINAILKFANQLSKSTLFGRNHKEQAIIQMLIGVCKDLEAKLTTAKSSTELLEKVIQLNTFWANTSNAWIKKKLFSCHTNILALSFKIQEKFPEILCKYQIFVELRKLFIEVKLMSKESLIGMFAHPQNIYQDFELFPELESEANHQTSKNAEIINNQSNVQKQTIQGQNFKEESFLSHKRQEQTIRKSRIDVRSSFRSHYHKESLYNQSQQISTSFISELNAQQNHHQPNNQNQQILQSGIQIAEEQENDLDNKDLAKTQKLKYKEQTIEVCLAEENKSQAQKQNSVPSETINLHAETTQVQKIQHENAFLKVNKQQEQLSSKYLPQPIRFSQNKIPKKQKHENNEIISSHQNEQKKIELKIQKHQQAAATKPVVIEKHVQKENAQPIEQKHNQPQNEKAVHQNQSRLQEPVILDRSRIPKQQSLASSQKGPQSNMNHKKIRPRQQQVNVTKQSCKCEIF